MTIKDLASMTTRVLHIPAVEDHKDHHLTQALVLHDQATQVVLDHQLRTLVSSPPALTLDPKAHQEDIQDHKDRPEVIQGHRGRPVAIQVPKVLQETIQVTKDLDLTLVVHRVHKGLLVVQEIIPDTQNQAPVHHIPDQLQVVKDIHRADLVDLVSSLEAMEGDQHKNLTENISRLEIKNDLCIAIFGELEKSLYEST